MKKTLTCLLLLLTAAHFSANCQRSHALAFSLDAASAGGVGFFGDDLLAPGSPGPPPLVLPGAAGIPPGPVPPPPPSDVDAFSFGRALPPGHTILGAEFSVTPGSAGAPGTAVAAESAFGDEPADIYGSLFFGGNGLLWDGDGIPTPGLGLFGPMGVPEPGSNVDGWDYGPMFGLPTAMGVHYSITPADALGHPVFAGTSAADIFFSPPVPGYSVMPVVYATAAGLGLMAGDNIDALSIIEDGVVGFTPGDVVFYSLAAGSPSLPLLTASPADILVTPFGGAPGVAFTAGSLGLLPTDDLDALDLVIIPEPSSIVLMGLGLPFLFRRKRS